MIGLVYSLSYINEFSWYLIPSSLIYKASSGVHIWNTIYIYLCFLSIFRVNSILIYLDGDYYEYHVGEKEEQGLAIGGYQPVFLTDLVASYLLEKKDPSKPYKLPRNLSRWRSGGVKSKEYHTRDEEMVSGVSSNSVQGSGQPTRPVHCINLEKWW